MTIFDSTGSRPSMTGVGMTAAGATLPGDTVIRVDLAAPVLTRRRFVQLAVPAAAMAAATTALSGRMAAAQAPIANVVFGLAAGVSRLDPYLTTDLVEQMVFFNLFDTPAHAMPDSSLAPSLALSWNSVNPTTWIFKLRDGVTWHNGDPFTAEDIVFSLARVVDPAAKSLFAGNFAAIDKASADDRLTLRITTKNPDPFMPMRLANYGAHVLPHKHFQAVGAAKFFEAPIGTGPYKFKEFVPGQSIVLERNDRYWTRPEFPTITFRKLPELSARTAAVRTGEVHVINGVSPDAVAQVNTASTQAVTSLSGSAFFLVVNMRTAPLGNRDVRHALSLALDRNSINRNLFGGQAQLLKEPILAGSIGTDPARPDLRYDPDQARDLLRKAGYNKEEILFETMANAYFGVDREIGEAMTAMWSAVGLNVKMSVIEPAVRAQKNAARAFNGLFAAYFASQYSDAAGLLWRSMNPQGILSHYWNVPGANDPAPFNQLGAKAVTSFDEKERAQLYKQMSDIMLEAMPWILLFQPPIIFATSKRVKLVPGPNILVNFRKETLSAI
ncbi:MAG: ABC transporter substrate-binding protein [Alphaproteobacteria bacterium]|nr:ABC transporter substrate-binding protein [Alphaproteobacteria bacterium]